MLSYTVEQVCELTSVGRTTVYAAIRSGNLVARKLGRRTILLRSDVDAWLAACPRTKNDAERRTASMPAPASGLGGGVEEILNRASPPLLRDK